MRHILLFLTIALIPTVLSSSPISPKSSSYIEGVWFDNYSNTELEIRNHRRGIKVRRNGRKWRTFNDMGRGVFDDCNGSAIIFLGRGEIKYRRKRNRPIYMARFDRFGRNRSGRNQNYRDDDRYGRGRSIQNNNNRSRSDFGNRNQYRGQWYCQERGVTLTIETYGNGGIRARVGNDNWDYYDTYRNNRFSNGRGSGYYFENNVLIWSSQNGRRKLRFRKG